MKDMPKSLGTIAEYLRIGLIVGLLAPEQASEWAYSIVAGEAEPPSEIIDLAWCKEVAPMIDALAAVEGPRDARLAGRWLLGLLRETLPETADGLQLATQRALSIARLAELGDDVHHRFDALDDELSLARTKVYGTVEACRSDIRIELDSYPSIDLVPGSNRSVR